MFSCRNYSSSRRYFRHLGPISTVVVPCGRRTGLWVIEVAVLCCILYSNFLSHSRKVPSSYPVPSHVLALSMYKVTRIMHISIGKNKRIDMIQGLLAPLACTGSRQSTKRFQGMFTCPSPLLFTTPFPYATFLLPFCVMRTTRLSFFPTFDVFQRNES